MDFYGYIHYTPRIPTQNFLFQTKPFCFSSSRKYPSDYNPAPEYFLVYPVKSGDKRFPHTHISEKELNKEYDFYWKESIERLRFGGIKGIHKINLYEKRKFT